MHLKISGASFRRHFKLETNILQANLTEQFENSQKDKKILLKDKEIQLHSYVTLNKPNRVIIIL